MSLLKKIYGLLSYPEQKKLPYLILIILFMAVFDVLGVASIMPFVAVVSDHRIIYEYEYAARLFEYLGIDEPGPIVFWTGGFVFICLVFVNIWKSFSSYYLHRFAFDCERSISTRLLEIYLQQPYVWFLNKNSSVLERNILSETSNAISYGVIPLANLLAQAALIVFLLVLLFYINPYVCLTVSVVITCLCWVLLKFFNKLLIKTSSERLDANADRFELVKESLALIKPIKSANLMDVFAAKYQTAAAKYSSKHALGLLIVNVPRYAIEAVAFGGMLLILVISVFLGHRIEEFLPLVAVYAFAGYRLLPAAQQIYTTVSSLKFAKPPVDLLFDDFQKLSTLDSPDDKSKVDGFKSEIKFASVYFSYPSTKRRTLSDLNVTLRKNEIVGLVGVSGSGKTTFVDLLLGILSPTAGEISIDGVALDRAKMAYSQKLFGYVSQTSYIADTSILKNIAFGVPDSAIDPIAVQRAAKAANLHNFIIRSLEDGYETVIGENGVRLSGGQRQRISIARALYNDPEFIVFDEATSSLDGLSERNIISSIRKLKGRKTIVMISHNLNTLSLCDKLILMSDGKIVAVDSYERLKTESAYFKSLSSEQT